MTMQPDNIDPTTSEHPHPGPASASEAAIELIHVVMHQFRSMQFQALRDNGHGLTHMESKALGFFSRCPGATVSDLVAHSGRDKAQLAKLVKGLRERNLLEAETDAADRRNIRLRPSAAGRAIQQAVDVQGQVLNQRALRGLNDSEQAQLVELLARVKANLDAPE